MIEVNNFQAQNESQILRAKEKINNEWLSVIYTIDKLFTNYGWRFSPYQSDFNSIIRDTSRGTPKTIENVIGGNDAIQSYLLAFVKEKVSPNIIKASTDKGQATLFLNDLNNAIKDVYKKNSNELKNVKSLLKFS